MAYVYLILIWIIEFCRSDDSVWGLISNDRPTKLVSTGIDMFRTPHSEVRETTRYGVRYGSFEIVHPNSSERCPSGVEPQRSEDGNIKWCRLDAECRNSYECVPIVGLIHFGTPVKYCCPTKSSYCTKKPHSTLDLSSCTKPSITLYFFDVERLKCRPTLVAGCNDIQSMVDEVQNRFGTLKDCRARCESTACEVGESPLYRDDDLDHPFLCISSDQCPHGHICRLDRLFRRQICCGRTQFDPCPGYRTFIVPFTGGPKQCDPHGQRDECPNDYVCMSSPENVFSYCCSNIRGVCPAGQRPYIHPLTASTIKCNPHSYDAACPNGYVCQPTVIGSTMGFCCSRAIVTNCPRNTKPFINVATNLPQKCTVGITVCTHGYQCQNTEPNSRSGFCCTPPSSAEYSFQTIPPLHRVFTTTERLIVSEETQESSASREDRSLRSQIASKPEDSLELSTESLSTRRSSSRKSDSITTVVNSLSCPEDFEAMVYPSTRLILHCTRGQKTGSDCPVPSKCLKAVGDPLGRALCCIHVDDKPSVPKYSASTEENTYKLSGGVQFGESTDPACPTIILSRGCKPGKPGICREEGFFCQFNKEFREFLCCSLNPPVPLY